MTGECPPEDELVRMVEGMLGDRSLTSIETHLDHCERCAAVIAALGSFAPPGSDGGAADEPRRIGRYQLDRRIAAGGMGEVWAAWDPQLRREIAVKLVRPDRSDDGKERERLLREARALARLGHPNVLAVHDVGEVDGEVFIATELVAGDTLATRGGPGADWRALVKLYVQAARGLAAAHAAGLVHRDVKPANLLIGADGRVRVADFGLAKRTYAAPSPMAPTERSADRSIAITATGHIAGTPAYMAPEQRAGQPADARVDQYALCVALVESLTSRRPPPDVDRERLTAMVAERRPPEPALNVLCTVVARGLAKDPRRRFPDTAALADALEAVVAARAVVPVAIAGPAHAAVPVAIVGASRTPPTRRPRRRGSAIAIVALAAGAGIIAALVVVDLASPGAPREASAAARHGPARTARPAGSSAEPVTSPAPAPPPAAPAHDAGVPAPAAAGSASTLLAEIGKAVRARDARRCLGLIAGVPPDTDPKLRDTVETLHAHCEMIDGDCARGSARLANLGPHPVGSPGHRQWLAAHADTYCPIEGDLDARLRRMWAQIDAFTGRTPSDHQTVAWCDALLAPATAASSEVTTAAQAERTSKILRRLGVCVSSTGRCDEARALWQAAVDADPSTPTTPTLATRCP